LRTFQTQSNPDILRQPLYNRKLEAKVAILATFLEGCTPNMMPYKAIETLCSMASFIPAPQGPVHQTHQFQFANGMHHMVNSNDPQAVELLEATLSRCHIFDVYAGLPNRVPRHAWLDNPKARGKIKETLISYKKTVSGPLLPNVNAILQGLNSLHVE